MALNSPKSVCVERCLKPKKLDHRSPLLKLLPHAGFFLLSRFTCVDNRLEFFCGYDDESITVADYYVAGIDWGATNYDRYI
ncbi:hypothetical protein CBM2599_B50410 [Cupriavidus taiwanensis]|nr:hypothetical protein CBM2599_B50410 [Cupriavidus taiwanensis]